MDNKTYFNQMKLLESDKQNRIEMCNELSESLYEYFEKDINSDKKTALIITLLLFKFNILDWNESVTENYIEYINDVLDGEKKVKKIDTADEVLSILNMVIDDATSITETTNSGINIEYTKSKERADFIARNITNKYNNINNHLIAIENGAKYHIWNAENDIHTRISHKNTDRQKKKIEEPFDVNGYFMMYPMDDSYGAPADEILNCRCTESFSNN